ncbi:MAG TPA: CRISPR-associated protein Cas4 [Firmicutes bacterium]|nr:CRISPR-associated protein Cas4 [Bacillota bacterium]
MNDLRYDSEDDFLMISELQHYYFCKRQWALIHVSQSWMENALTMEGRFLHERADDPFLMETRGNLLISRAMPVASKQLGLTGVIDVVEFQRCDDGVSVNGREGKWRPNIVEYKHGKPKKNLCDVMQLTAQVVCLEEMLGCSISTADLFYATPNRRVTVNIDADLRRQLQNLALELHFMFNQGIIPKAESYRNCSKCSLYELCMPRLTKKPRSVNNYMAEFMEERDA